MCVFPAAPETSRLKGRSVSYAGSTLRFKALNSTRTCTFFPLRWACLPDMNEPHLLSRRKLLLKMRLARALHLSIPMTKLSVLPLE